MEEKEIIVSGYCHTIVNYSDNFNIPFIKRRSIEQAPCYLGMAGWALKKVNGKAVSK